MKIVPWDKNQFILYLNQSYISDINFEEKKEVERYFKSLFSKLKEYYHIELCGYYDITCYQDDYYGIVLRIEKEDIDYFDYFNHQVDMRIMFEKGSCFLYKIIDPFMLSKEIKSKGTIYRHQNQFYFKLNQMLDDILFGKLLEQSELCYKNTLPILKYGKIVYSN